MQILPKTNPSETKVTNTGVSKPPQIGGSTVSRSRGLENNFFHFRNHFLKIHTRGIPKMSDFYVFGPFLAEKTAVKEKKARFDPFVPPTHFQKQVGWGTRLAGCSLHCGCPPLTVPLCNEAPGKSWKCGNFDWTLIMPCIMPKPNYIHVINFINRVGNWN